MVTEEGGDGRGNTHLDRGKLYSQCVPGAGHCHCCHCWRLVSWSVTWQIVTQIIVPMMELLCVGFTRFLGQLLRLLALRVAMSGPAAGCGLIVVEESPQQRCLHPDYCQPAIDSNNWLSVVSSMTFNRKSVFLSSSFSTKIVLIVIYILCFHHLPDDRRDEKTTSRK